MIALPENAPGLPPRISDSSNFREIVWGVSDQKHLLSLAEDLSRDRHVDSPFGGEVVDAASGRDSFGYGGHAGEDVGQRLPFAKPFAERV